MTAMELKAFELYVGEKLLDNEITQAAWDGLPEDTKTAYLEFAATVEQ